MTFTGLNVSKPEVNIGLVGHVDHGKTTLTQALSGKWTDTFSEEMKRGITIKLGYANTNFYKDKSGYNAEGKGELKRCVSFVDAPGHEALMAVMLAASSVMDGAILVVDAQEGVRAQTREHAMAIKIAGIKNVVVVQNKIDSVSKETALEKYRELREFLDSYGISAPIIPISALHNVNIDLLIEAIEENIPTPKRDPKADAKFLVVRSFDVNKPGTDLDKLVGGVLGGALVKGKLKVGDTVEIRPGVEGLDGWKPLETKIVTLATESQKLKEASPGGNLAIGATIDPSMTKQDSMLGAVIGTPGKLPPMWDSVSLRVELFDHVVGFEDTETRVEPLREGEPLIINVNTALSIGAVTKSGKNVQIKLKKPICADREDRFVISRRIDNKWRLIGYGTIV